GAHPGRGQGRARGEGARGARGPRPLPVTTREAARRMALCCRQLAERGLIAGQDGNVSVRIAPDRVLVTPRGLVKALLQPSDMVEVDMRGRSRGLRRNPTSELDLHLRILRARPDVGAVVHANPPTAT